MTPRPELQLEEVEIEIRRQNRRVDSLIDRIQLDELENTWDVSDAEVDRLMELEESRRGRLGGCYGPS